MYAEYAGYLTVGVVIALGCYLAIRRNFPDHRHEWVIVENKPLGGVDTPRSGMYYTLQCKVCGDLKTHRVD